MKKILHKINPCDMDSPDWMLPIANFLAFFAKGTDCICCLGTRVLLALIVGIVIGVVL